MKIIIDSAEPKHVPEVFREAGFDVTVKRITGPDGKQVGDMLGPNYIIERKTEEDFWASMPDGRLYEQMAKMTEYYPTYWRIIILEGSLANIRSAHPIKNKNWINSIRWTAMQWGVFLIQVEDMYDFVDQVKIIAEKAGEEPKRRIARQKVPKGIMDNVKFMCGLPGISLKRAETTLKTVGCPKVFFDRIFNDRENLLIDLKIAKAKIGEITLDKIESVLLTGLE